MPSKEATTVIKFDKVTAEKCAMAAYAAGMEAHGFDVQPWDGLLESTKAMWRNAARESVAVGIAAMREAGWTVQPPGKLKGGL